MKHGSPAPSLFVTAASISVAAFVAGMGLMQLFQHREDLLELTRDSYQARFSAMTSLQSTPRRYYVLHEGHSTLEEFAAREPAVLALTPTRFDKLSAVDIQPGNESVMERIRTLDGVHYALRGNIPLFCH